MNDTAIEIEWEVPDLAVRQYGYTAVWRVAGSTLREPCKNNNRKLSFSTCTYQESMTFYHELKILWK